MDIIERIRDEEERDLFFIQEELRDMANFVRIGKRIVNLDNVQTVHYNPTGGMNYDNPCVEIDFGGSENYLSIFKKSEPVAFAQLMAWMGAQPALLPVIDVEQPALLSDEE